MTIWDPSRECMSRDELEQLQLERLQATANRVYKNVTHYRKIFTERGIIPEDIQSLTDLTRHSLYDPRRSAPELPLRYVCRAAPGSRSHSLLFRYDQQAHRHGLHEKRCPDLVQSVARFMTAAGVTRDDLVQIAFNYGLFTGAFGLHYGAEAIGASVIPTSTGNTEKQIMIMQDYKTTVLVCTPSYALILADRMNRHGDRPEGAVTEGGAVRRRALVGSRAHGN